MAAVVRESILDPQIGNKRLRHKASFVHQFDSSEEDPSSHDSFFEAEYPSITSDGSMHDPISWQAPPPDIQLRRSFPLGNISNVDPARVVSISKILSAGHDPTPLFNGGPGKPLATIVEQNSNSTIRSAASDNALPYPYSTSDLRSSIHASAPHLLTRGNSIDTNNSGCLSRCHSLSADDLQVIKRFYHNTLSDIESAINNSTYCTPFDLNEIYASPRRPLPQPSKRLPTLLSHSSWTAAQNDAFLIRPLRTANRLERLLGIEPRDLQSSSRASSQTRKETSSRGPVGPISGHVFTSRRVLSAPVPSAVQHAQHFQPPENLSGGPLKQHPFMRVVPGPRISSVGKTGEGFLVASGTRMAGQSDTCQRGPALNTDESNRSQIVGSAPLALHMRRVVLSKAKIGGLPVEKQRRAAAQWESTPMEADDFGLTVPGSAVASSSMAEPTAPQKALNTVQVSHYKDAQHTISLHKNLPLNLETGKAFPQAGRTDSANAVPVENAASSVAEPESLLQKDQHQSSWRCRVTILRNALDTRWERSMGTLSWYCCGVDVGEKSGTMGAAICRETSE